MDPEKVRQGGGCELANFKEGRVLIHVRRSGAQSMKRGNEGDEVQFWLVEQAFASGDPQSHLFAGTVDPSSV